MNNQLDRFARSQLKESLGQCSEAQQLMFKRMYANGKIDLSIDTVVDQMPDEKLDWAMQQVERTLANQNKEE